MAETAIGKAEGVDERLRKTPLIRKLMNRPELGAVAGAILVFLFFAVFAGGSGMFSARGLVGVMEVSSQLGILAIAVSLLMIGGEFDLSVGSMIAFAGLIFGVALAVLGLPPILAIAVTFLFAGLMGALNGQLSLIHI